MARMGRPPVVIDKRQFEALCAIQCTKEEISFVLGCDADTLNGWCKREYKDAKGKPMTFSAVFRQKRANGAASLRRMQWKLAEKSAAMAIFLGKNILGQSDNPETAIDQENTDELLSEAGLDEV